MRKHIIYICLILAGICACNTDEVEVYSSARYLFFPDSSKGLDSVKFSFYHYPGATTHEVSFYIPGKLGWHFHAFQIFLGHLSKAGFQCSL